jgi:hypothetical protein
MDKSWIHTPFTPLVSHPCRHLLGPDVRRWRRRHHLQGQAPEVARRILRVGFDIFRISAGISRIWNSWSFLVYKRFVSRSATRLGFESSKTNAKIGAATVLSCEQSKRGIRQWPNQPHIDCDDNWNDDRSTTGMELKKSGYQTRKFVGT